MTSVRFHQVRHPLDDLIGGLAFFGIQNFNPLFADSFLGAGRGEPPSKITVTGVPEAS